MLLKKGLIISVSFLVMLGLGYGVYLSLHSQLFILRKVEIIRAKANPFVPSSLNDETVITQGSIQVGKASLFSLNMEEVKRRLLTHEWIRGAVLIKKFPDTLVVTLSFREPKAILQNSNGSLSYLDEGGRMFFPMNLENPPDLPLLTGFSDVDRMKEALQFLNRWEAAELREVSWISSVIWDPDRGYRLLLSYPIEFKNPTRNGEKQNRVMIDMGQEIDGSVSAKISRLGHVIHYLSSNSIAARQIWADEGKKVVVKTVTGS